MAIVIDQQQNYKAEFGSIYRSSGIFLKPKGIKCTISVSNYWDYKNNLDVSLVYSVRNLKGKLVARREYRFDNKNVLNIVVNEVEEGSVELEAFSNKNLRIPYAAIMVIYETETNICMVHTYGRNHSLIELEDNKSITDGKEGCWTVRNGDNIENIAYFHNGHQAVEKQNAKLILTNYAGIEKEVDFELLKILPFETVIFDIAKICPDYKKHLENKDGWANIHFINHSSFTRLLVSWYDSNNKNFQVTHSNFDYSEHRTNLVKAEKLAYMKLPKLGEYANSNVIVYPRSTQGKYITTIADQKYTFESGLTIELDNKATNSLSFKRTDGDLPSRIVTAIVGKKEDQTLPFECSFGVIHEMRPPKHFHWAVLSLKFNSKLFITDYREIYGLPEKDIELSFSLYNPYNTDILKKKISYKSLDDIPDSIDPKDIFGDGYLTLKDDFGYLSVYSNFGGFIMFTSVEKNNSLSIEHAF